MIVTINNSNSYKIDTLLYSNNSYIGTYSNSYYCESDKSELFIEQLTRLLLDQAQLELPNREDGNK